MARRKALTRLKVTKDLKVKLITFLSPKELNNLKQVEVDFNLSTHEAIHLALGFGLKTLLDKASQVSHLKEEEAKKEVEEFFKKIRESY